MVVRIGHIHFQAEQSYHIWMALVFSVYCLLA